MKLWYPGLSFPTCKMGTLPDDSLEFHELVRVQKQIGIEEWSGPPLGWQTILPFNGNSKQSDHQLLP